MATKRQSYTTPEKLKIIQFAEEHGNRAAQREFGIAESNVRSFVRFNLTCPQIELSVKLARKLWRFGQLETKRIAWRLSWHAQETVPSWNRWLFSNAKPCPKLQTNMASLLLCSRRDGWMKISWKFGSRKFGDHESEDLEDEGVFLCLILSKPIRPSKSSVHSKARTQIADHCCNKDCKKKSRTFSSVNLKFTGTCNKLL